jgi:hypothetical protein
MPLTFALVDVDGVVRALDDTTGVNVAVGSKGLGFPKVQPNGDKLPYAPGVALRRISTAPSVLDLPIELQAGSAALLDALLDTVRGWVMPGTERRATPRSVFLRVTRDDGAVREIEGVYMGGLEGDDMAGVETWQDAILSLYCPEAYWRDVAEIISTFTSGGGAHSWFPYWPYDLMPSALFSESTVTNTGQIETWPVWTITGPGTDVVLTNVTTGEELALTANGGLVLAAGDVVTIDTRVPSITNQNGVNLFPYLSAGSSIWPLEVGANVIQVAMSGATVDSSVELAYQRRWAGGHR